MSATPPPEVEIVRPLDLDGCQQRLIDMHSVYNVLSVLLNQVAQIGVMAGDLAGVAPIAHTLQTLRDCLADRAGTLAELRRVQTLRARIVGALEALAPRVPQERQADFRRRLGNVESIFNIVEVRAVELISRADDPHRWERFTLANLEANLRDVFDAIARNSLGRYRVVYSPEARSADTYTMRFSFQSLDGVGLVMPSVLQDVVRDLASNARKYSDPPAEIDVALWEEREQLRVVVTDQGRGIPESEIADVVEFGRRASNVAQREQTGGGFGLTKAYAVTRIFGGRMWVRSAPGRGTRVTITLPRPR